MRANDLVGKTFGPWEVVKRIGSDEWYNSTWEVLNKETSEVQIFSLPILKQIERNDGRVPNKRNRKTSVDLKNRTSYLLRKVPDKLWERFTKKCSKLGKDIIARIRELVDLDIQNKIPADIEGPTITPRQKTSDRPLVGLDRDVWFKFKDKCILTGTTIRKRLIELIWFDIVN